MGEPILDRSRRWETSLPNVLSGITVDCNDPARLAAFWGALLGREEVPSLPGWRQLGHHGDTVPGINFQPVPEPKSGKARLHLDVSVDDIEEGIHTVLRLGGRSLDQRHEYDEGVVVVMADPEGNEFCLVQYYPSDAANDWVDEVANGVTPEAP